MTTDVAVREIAVVPVTGPAVVQRQPAKPRGFLRNLFRSDCLACETDIPLFDEYCSEVCEMQHTRVPELGGL